MSVLSDKAKFMSGPWGSKENPMCNPNVQASVAGVNAFTYPITRVSGTEAMTGITVPYDGFQGRITIIPTGVFTWTNATNIAIAGTAVVSKALDFIYDPVAAKWYPSYLA